MDQAGWRTSDKLDLPADISILLWLTKDVYAVPFGQSGLMAGIGSTGPFSEDLLTWVNDVFPLQ
jgi:hypothetical protein